MKISLLFKYSASFIVFFLLFYFETVEIFGVKFAVLWKILLLFLISLFSLTMVAKKGLRIPKLSFWGITYSFQSLLNISLFSNPIGNLSESIKNLFLPIFYLASHSGNQRQFSYNLIITLSIFIAISTIPFLLGFINPISSGGYDLSIFGIDGSGFVGIFQNAHTAAITLGTAVIVLIYDFYYRGSLFQRTILLILIAVSLTALYKTFARTGYFLFLLGFITYFITNKNIRHRLLKLTFFVATLFFFIFLLYLSSEVFRMRLFGENIYTSNSDSADIGSGRLLFFTTAIHYFFNQDIITMFVGLGPELAKDLMGQHIGMKISAHNGFVNILQYNGFLGLILYLFFFFFFSIKVYSTRASIYFPLIASLYISYLSQMLVQGERVFLADAIFALALSLPDNLDSKLVTGKLTSQRNER